MNNFFDIESNRKLTPEEYFQWISVPIKRQMVNDLFASAFSLLENIRSGQRPTPDLPQIRISITQEIIMQGIDGLIELSTGFVDMCLGAFPSPIHEVVEDAPNTRILPVNIPNFLFCWAFAHEYHHGIRKHNIVLDVVSVDELTLQAIELDADLCGVASLYRWAQVNLAKDFSSVTIKQIVLAGVFWSIRSIADPVTNRSHLPTSDRLYHLMLKIAHLRANPYDPPDPDCSTDETKQSFEALINCIIRCEQLYQRKLCGEDLGLLKSFLALIERRGWSPVVQRWEEIRYMVSVSSGTKA